MTVDLRSEYRFWHFADRHRELLRARFPDVRWAVLEKETEAPDLPRSDAVLAWRFSAEQLDRAPHLRWLACPAAGSEHLPVAEAARREVIVTRGVGYHGVPMAEHVMGLVLGFARGLFLSAARQSVHRWWKDEVASEFRDVAGSTMTVVGCGAVGHDVARLASAVGMRVWGVRRRPALGGSPHVERWYGSDEADDALGGADVVVNLLPSTVSTTHYFDTARFSALRPGAVFINVGRGSTVDEAALLQALESRRVSWCGLDVTAAKPPALNDPLRHHPRVVLTPKSAVFTHRYMDEAVSYFAENLERYLAGRPLQGVVDASSDDPPTSTVAASGSVGGR
ncbi:MAG: D-2-hydroxyacid dehydrogenase [Pseudonocardia sp.]